LAHNIKIFAIGFFLIFSINISHAASWWNNNWNYRASLTVNSGNYKRSTRPAEVSINFTRYFSSNDASTAFDINSIRVHEVNANGQIIAGNIPFQFDPTEGYNAVSNANGTLVFLLRNNTSAHANRYFHVYFDVTGGGYARPSFANQVKVTDNVFDEGQRSFLINTDTANYYYQKIAGGFSSILDKNGNDWINHHPTGGSAGSYRGIPNLVPPWDGGYFHPGETTSVSTLLHKGPLKATIRSKTVNGRWEIQWEFFPQFARMTVNRADKTFWFLYEGTPGGRLDANDFVVRSDGTRTPYGSPWKRDLSTHEWVYFSDTRVGKSIFLAHHEDDNAMDSYRQMENQMTVFGFGRDNLLSLIQPQSHHFTIGIANFTDFSNTSATLLSAYKDIPVTISSIDQNTHTLPHNQWHQISLPFNPGANNSVNQIFGDDGLGTYGSDWIVFSYDTNRNLYAQQGLNNTLKQGVGYWIVQLTGSNKTLDMPQGSNDTPTINHAACPTGRCFKVPLGTRTADVQWNLVGYPFSTGAPFNSTRIGTTDSSCRSGCTIDTAFRNDIFHNQVWSYNGSNYKIIDTRTGYLNPWLGYWAATLNNSQGKAPSLLIPKP